MADGNLYTHPLSKIAFILYQLHATLGLHHTRPAKANDQKNVYLQDTISHYGLILERYAKGPRMGLDFESMHSFLSGSHPSRMFFSLIHRDRSKYDMY